MFADVDYWLQDRIRPEPDSTHGEDADAARFAWIVRCLSSWDRCHGWQCVYVKGEGCRA
jgi:hypothetical protein